MKKIVPTWLFLSMWCVGIAVASLVPADTFASSVRPTCNVSVTIDGVKTELRNNADVFVRAGGDVLLSWESRHATVMRDKTAKALPVIGSATTTVRSATRSTYRFTGDSGSVTCTVSLRPVSGVVTSPSSASSSRPLTLKGTARGVSSIVIRIIPVGTTSTTTMNSERISLRRSVWSYAWPQILKDGNYYLEVATINRGVRTIIATSTLAVGVAPLVAGTESTTVVVVPVPLLIGGLARPNVPVAVAYLQLINIGYATATVAGITLTQYGTAPVASVIQLTAVTDNGIAKGAVGTIHTGTPFVGNTVTVPLGVVLAPREMRLVTVKAITVPTISPYLGKTLALWVTGVQTGARVQSKLPLYGTTWTYGF